MRITLAPKASRAVGCSTFSTQSLILATIAQLSTAGGENSTDCAPVPTRFNATGAGVPHLSCRMGASVSTLAANGPSSWMQVFSAVATSVSLQCAASVSGTPAGVAAGAGADAGGDGAG